MAYAKKTFELVQSPAFVASGNIQAINLPTDGVITELVLPVDVHLLIPTSGSSFNPIGIAAACYTLLNVIAAGKVFWSTNSPLLHIAHMRQRGIQILADPLNANTTGADVTFRVQFVIHFGGDVQNPHDLSAGIIGPRYSSGGLLLNMTWPASTAAGAGGVSILSTTVLRCRVSEVIMDNADLNALIAGGFAEPSFTEQDYALSNATTSSTGYNTTQNLPTQTFLRGATILQESSATAETPTDANLQYFGYFKGANAQIQVDTGHWIDEVQRAQRLSGQELQVANAPIVGGHNVGMDYLDFRRVVDTSNPAPLDGSRAYSIGHALALWGADFRQAPVGDNYFGMSVSTATGQLRYLWEQLTPLS